MCSCFVKKNAMWIPNKMAMNPMFVWSWIQSQLSKLFKFASAPCESAESVYCVCVHRIYHHDIIYYCTPFLLVSSADFEPYLFQARWWKLVWFSASTGCSTKILSIWDMTEGDGRWWAHCSDQNVVNHSETAYPHHASQPSAVEHLQSSHEWKQCHKLGACPLRCQKTM